MGLIDSDGRISDKGVNDLGMKFQKEVTFLFKDKPNLTMEDRVVIAYHLQGYISSVVSGSIIENLMKKQGGTGATPNLRPVPSTDKQ